MMNKMLGGKMVLDTRAMAPSTTLAYDVWYRRIGATCYAADGVLRGPYRRVKEWKRFTVYRRWHERHFPGFYSAFIFVSWFKGDGYLFTSKACGFITPKMRKSLWPYICAVRTGKITDEMRVQTVEKCKEELWRYKLPRHKIEMLEKLEGLLP